MQTASPGTQTAELHNPPRLPWLNREVPFAIATLVVMVSLFLADHWLVRSYQRREVTLAQRFYDVGSRQLAAGQADSAVASFRTALLYARDDVRYRLRLAEALISTGRYNEARSHLDTLLEESPGNAEVNLDLARVSAYEGNINAALRFFQGAIYGQWAEDPVEHRRDTRFELINFLLRNHQIPQAQSELLGLAAELPPDTSLLIETAGLFERVQDHTHALDLYRKALEITPLNAGAAVGAGTAAFHLEDYALAGHFLHKAVAERPKDEGSKSLLALTTAVLRLDPYRRTLRPNERSARVITSFRLAGERLQKCGAASPSITAGNTEDLSRQWTQLKREITPRSLARDPDLDDKAMDLVFQVEKQPASECPPASLEDQALLLLSRKRGENER